mmetsp:Transcript_124952/g.400273  ORF Transcript_124952/g.400273 Transcript_124952/m.400273 type:complete len:204 (+) Transcript_124952:1685-2296(+)
MASKKCPNPAVAAPIGPLNLSLLEKQPCATCRGTRRAALEHAGRTEANCFSTAASKTHASCSSLRAGVDHFSATSSCGMAEPSASGRFSRTSMTAPKDPRPSSRRHSKVRPSRAISLMACSPFAAAAPTTAAAAAAAVTAAPAMAGGVADGTATGTGCSTSGGGGDTRRHGERERGAIDDRATGRKECDGCGECDGDCCGVRV